MDDQLDRSSDQLDEEYAVRCKLMDYRHNIDVTNNGHVWTNVDVRDAVQRSMAALEESDCRDLSAFLSCNGKSMRKVFLATNSVNGCVCLVGMKDGELEWGKDAMLLDFPGADQLDANPRRGHYLQAVALFGGEVSLDDIQLDDDEARLFLETLESSSSPPHSLHVYRRFRTNIWDFSWKQPHDITGCHLLETVRRNGKIEVVTVALSNLIFDRAPAPIPSLQSLTLIHVKVTNEFFEGLAAQLHEWTSLSSLSFSHVFTSRLRPQVEQISLRPQDWQSSLISQVWQSSLCSFLESVNPRLKHLVLEGLHSDSSHDVQFLDFLKVLGTNTSLESLSLASLSSLKKSDTAKNLLMDAIKKNELLHLNLQKSPFENFPAIQAQLRLKTATHRQLLRSFVKVPATAVRLFICGDAYAGKTTLLKTLSNQSRKGFHFKTLLGAYNTSTSKRTRGIQIQSLVQDGIQVSAWDMAGQEEFHAFHDHMFPDMSDHGAPAIFLFVWSPVDSKNGNIGNPKSAEAFEASLRYWLRFIASKTCLSNVACKVNVVLTRKDQMALVKDGISAHLINLQDTFRKVIEIAGIYDVNARNSTSVKAVAASIFECARSVLQDVMVYKVCHEINTHLSAMAARFLSWEDFQKICIERHAIGGIEQQTALALSLHESGQLLYFRNVPFVILDTNWFCCKVMGELIHFTGQPVRGIPFEGFVSQKYLEKILGQGALSSFNISAAHLVDLMEAMHLCCKVPDAHSNFFIPSTLPRGSKARTLGWRRNANDQYHHVGRRLQCRDKVVTFLTPGLFAVIQVAFKKAFDKSGGDVILHKHLISIYYQCMEIIVEFCKSNGENVMDILVRSSGEVDTSTTLEVMEEKVMRTIVRICAEPIGNQGVELVVGIIRPKCLILPAPAHEREDQYVSIENLKEDLQQQLQERPRQNTFWHTWKHNRYFEAGEDSIMDLLGFDEYWNVVKSYKSILQEVDKEMKKVPVED